MEALFQDCVQVAWEIFGETAFRTVRSAGADGALVFDGGEVNTHPPSAPFGFKPWFRRSLERLPSGSIGVGRVRQSRNWCAYVSNLSHDSERFIRARKC